MVAFFDVLGNISAVHATSTAYAANTTLDMRQLQSSFIITFILSFINLTCILLIRQVFLHQASAFRIPSSAAPAITVVGISHDVTNFIWIIIWQFD